MKTLPNNEVCFFQDGSENKIYLTSRTKLSIQLYVWTEVVENAFYWVIIYA